LNYIQRFDLQHKTGRGKTIIEEKAILGEPLVTIVTACFNSAQTIADCMNSVLQQTYSNIEYVIVDGQSKDSTLATIKSLAPKFKGRLRIVSESDEGISDAFNKGISLANGDIIGILNSDDMYALQTVERAVALFSENTGFVFGNLIYLNKAGKELFLQYGDPEYEKRINFVMPNINHPTVFVRKEIYSKYGLFDKSLKYAMDYDFMLRLHKFNVKGEYNENIIAYMRTDGKSDDKFINAYRECRDISIKHGFNPTKAHLHFWFACTKSLLRRSLEKIFPYEFVKKIRKTFNKAVK
jgi:glycosyltransferase involved in cell wall biosynthesis